MKHVKQDTKECALAVCAMVSGREYADVQKYAWERFPSHIGIGYDVFEASKIWGHFGLPWVSKKQYEDAPVVDLAQVTLKGRGHLLYRSPKMYAWHNVAFESGMIYDGQEPKPKRLYNWATTCAAKRDRGTFCQVIVTHIKTQPKQLFLQLSADICIHNNKGEK